MSLVTNNSNLFYSNQNTRYIFIDGNANDTLEKCYNTLQQQLSIPNYFGKNLDALEEVMNDLDWIKEEKIIIIFLNNTSLLINDSTYKKDFLEIIESANFKNLEINYIN